MRATLQRSIAISLLLAGSLLLRPVTVDAQTIAHVNGSFCVGVENVFVYEGSGSVSSWTVTGNYTINGSGSNYVYVTWNAAGTGTVTAHYSSGSVSYNGGVTITSNAAPTISISASTNNVCAGTSITFTASAGNAGSSPYYEWFVNGTEVSGVTGTTYTTSSLTNGQQVSCTVVSSALCASPSTGNSNVITMTIGNRTALTPTIAGTTSICGSSPSVGYTCSVPNGGGTLSYQWQRNGANISSNEGSPPANALAYGPVNNGDKFQCVVSSNGCYSPGTSNSITVAVTSPQTFSVGIGVTGGISYCTGQSITLNASPSQPATGYQWLQNGANILNATGSTYTTTVTSLAQLQGLGCLVTTGATCLTSNSATGTAANIPFTVNTTVTPSVSISASVGNIICSGASETFTASVVNGGSGPQFQWLLNGTPVTGATSSTWTTTALTNGQQVSCQLTSNAACVTAPTVTSNVITMNVTQTQQMTLTIYGNSPVCQGSGASFYALAGNTAGNLTYQWIRNQTPVGSDGPGAGNLPANELEYEEINNGDVFSCKLTTDAGCYLGVTSNSVTMATTQLTPFYEGILVHTIDYCQGSTVTLTASQPAASYQWYSYGNYIPGAEGPTYQATATSVADLQAITLQVTTQGSCISNPQATGTTASIPFSISPWVTASLNVSANPSVLTVNTPITFTANTVNGGNDPSFQWQLNGQNVGDNSGSFTYTFTSGSEYQSVGVAMVSNGFCVSNPTLSSTVPYQLHLADWEDQNFIRIHELQVPGVASWIGVGNTAIGDKTETTVYFDGFGRRIQQVNKEMATPPTPTGTWGDIVLTYAYDPYGRSPQGYLPYTTTTQLGQFKTDPLTEQPQYYTNNYNESPAYTQAAYDNSALNRVTNTKQAGSVWNSSPGNSIAYDLNDATADNVQNWYAGDNPGDVPVNLGPYASNTLYKTTSTDNNGNLVIAYTNNAGQTVLKKVEVSKTHSSPYDGWICTYNVYNDRGLLRWSLEAEAVKYLAANSWSFTGTDLLNQLCFRYEYDERGRTTLKKTPGAKELYTVYDNRDRAVFAQDGNQRDKTPGEWTATLYDALDRPVLNTLYETSASAQTLQTQIPTTNTSTSLSISAQGATVSAFNSPLAAADLNNSSVTTVQQYYFYDGYTWPGAKTFNTNFSNLQAYSAGDPMTPTQRTLGMATGKLVRVLGTNNFLGTSVYYDEKGRPLQRAEDNILTGADITTSQYRFDGMLLSSDVNHSTTGTGYTNFDVLSKYLLDARSRVGSIQKQIGSNAWKTIASYDYDDMGRGTTKHLDPGYTGSGKTELESLTYSYNLNSQLTGINKDYALKTAGIYNKWGNFFGVYIGYDNKDGVFAANQLDGQATGVVWSTMGDDVQRKYDYSYDPAGRFINAAFVEKQNTTDAWSNSQTDFSVTGDNGQIQYDLNGNLLNLIHRGLVQGNATYKNIDDLTYQYNTLSNTLIHVSDASSLGTTLNGAFGDFKPRTTSGGNDYVYDDNGNLLIDLNKNITGIGGTDGNNGVHYNYLDKPEIIRIPGKGTVNILYNADGIKLQRTFTPDGGTAGAPTSYINEFTYQGNNMEYINFDEGRIRVMQTVPSVQGYDMLSMDGNIDLPGSNRGAYDYFITDQLGSVRMILTEETHSATNTCTMEPDRDPNEAPVFGQVDANGTPTAANEVEARFAVTSIPGQTTGNGWTDPTIQNWVSQIGNFASSRIGPNMLVKVMAGDQVSAQVQYYYQDPVTNSSGGPSAVANALASMAAAIAGGPATTGAVHTEAAASNAQTMLNGSVPLGLTADPDADNPSGSAPKAYLTVLYFDERFNFIAEGSLATRVLSSGNGAAPLIYAPTPAPKNGYAYIYVSNESDEMVYFDNLQVNSVRGNILQENHYYPHGLKMAALSSSRLPSGTEGMLPNNFEYQADNAETDPDIGWAEFDLRNYDPQIGRYIQQDPYDQFASPYVGMGNDPVNNVDEDGGFSVPGAVIGGLTGFIVGGIYGLANDKDPVTDAAIGMTGGALLGGLIGSVDLGGLFSQSTTLSSTVVHIGVAQVLSSGANAIAISAAPVDPNSAGWLIDMPLPKAALPGVQSPNLSPGHPSAPPLQVAPPQILSPNLPTPPPVPPASTTSTPPKTNPAPANSNPPKTSKTSYFDEALKHSGVKYVWGGSNPKTGFDCSGLLCIVTGIYDPRFYARDPEHPAPPGGWERVTIPPGTSYDDFLKIVQKGDLFIWRGEHVTFYAGDQRTFGAKKKGVVSGFSRADKYFNELKQYWIQGYTGGDGTVHAPHGYPEVWRQK